MLHLHDNSKTLYFFDSSPGGIFAKSTPAFKSVIESTAASLHGAAVPVGGGKDVRVDRAYRWMSKDYEYLTERSDAFIYASMIRLMLSGSRKYQPEQVKWRFSRRPRS